MQAALKYDGGAASIKKVFVAAGALAAGDVVVDGSRIHVVSGTKAVAAGDDYTGQLTGVFELDATSADVWADGDLLYWDDTTNKLTDVASTHKSAGIAMGAKAATVLKALVDLNASVASTTI